MIGGWLAAWSSLASGATWTVNTATDTAASGSLRHAMQNAAPGDLITFQSGVFGGGGVPTTITVSNVLGPLPTLNDPGVVLDGDGRVAIACHAAMTTGNGVTVAADDVHVRGLEVRDCPTDGIRVSGHDVQVIDNHVHHNDQAGINVTGLSSTTSATTIELNDAHDNCVAPAGVSCAGVIVKKGTGSGVGPANVWIAQNFAHDQLSGAHGISVQAGSGALVFWNTADDNTGSGISVAATTTGVSVDTVNVGNNVVTGNLGPGILLGTRSSFVLVASNTVEANGLGATPAPGISVYASDDHTLEANTVTSNGAEGILVSGLAGNPASPAERVTLRDNVVGTDADSTAGLGNTTTALRITGSGAAAVNHLVEGNTFAGGTTGILIDAGAVTLTENVVGLGPDRTTALGAQGAGITVQPNGVGSRIDGRTGGVDRPNYIAANGGPGLVVMANGVLVSDNVIGWGRTGEALGNADEGIWLKAGADVVLRRNRVGNSGDEGILVWASGATPVTRPTLNGNLVEDNADAGIRVETVSGSALWTENRATNNGACALKVATTVNTATRDSIPFVTDITGGYLEGATGLVPVGFDLDHIEVFADDGSEAGRYLGTAAVAGGGWFLTLADDEPPIEGKRVSAVAVYANQTTGARQSSRMAEWCNDGCPEPGPASCEDGNDCTTDTCGATCTHTATSGGVCNGVDAGCVGYSAASTCAAGVCTPTIFADEGTACVDEDACTKNSTCGANHMCGGGGKIECEDGNPCTSDGTKDAVTGEWTGHECDPQLGCPTAVLVRPEGYPCDDGDLCNTGMGVCNAVGGCEDIDPTPSPNPETACTDCVCDPPTGWSCEGRDDDGWCVPDDFWIEALGRPDRDCFVDGDLGSEWDSDDDGFPDVWERSPDAIDVDCDGTPDDLIPGPLFNRDFFDEDVKNVLYEVDWMAGEADHDHVPGEIDQIVGMFAAEGIVVRLHRDDEVPHVARVSFAQDGWPRFGDEPWVRFADVKRAHFDVARRRGVYHYGLLGHSLDEETRANGIAGIGENFGDDAFNDGIHVYGDPDAAPEYVGMGLVVHEWGHNFGLNHNGTVPRNIVETGRPYHDAILDRLDVEDLTPGSSGTMEVNHLSSMNYLYGSGELITVDREQNWDYARSYNNTADPQDTVDYLLNELHVGSLYPEADTFWSHTWPIPDAELYKAKWRCPAATGLHSRRGFQHRPGRTTLTAADRRLDLDCDGLGEAAAVVSGPIEYRDGQPVDDHSSFDEWKSLVFDFQRDAALNRFGHLRGTEVDAGLDMPTPQLPSAELLGGCVAPKIPRGTSTTWRTPVVLFGSPTFRGAALQTVELAGAPSVHTEVLDWDEDGWNDLWMEFRPADMTALHTNATTVSLRGERANGREVLADFPITRVTAPPDTDGDGIQDACDACPTQGHPPGGHRLPDGCPP